MDKRIENVADAVAEIPDGATVMIGGFGGSGAPIELIHALIEGDLTGSFSREFGEGGMVITIAFPLSLT